MIWVFLLLISCASAICYRMGGCSPEDLEAEWGWVPGWIRAFPKKRDVGCNLLTAGAAVIVGVHGPWWAWLLLFGLTWGALSTYWDELFGFDNHWFHGFMIGMSFLPLAFFCEPLSLGIRCLALAILMGGYSKIVTNATWEELGRGFVMPITLGLVVLL